MAYWPNIPAGVRARPGSYAAQYGQYGSLADLLRPDRGHDERTHNARQPSSTMRTPPPPLNPTRAPMPHHGGPSRNRTNVTCPGPRALRIHARIRTGDTQHTARRPRNAEPATGPRSRRVGCTVHTPGRPCGQVLADSSASSTAGSRPESKPRTARRTAPRTRPRAPHHASPSPPTNKARQIIASPPTSIPQCARAPIPLDSHNNHPTYTTNNPRPIDRTPLKNNPSPCLTQPSTANRFDLSAAQPPPPT
jgi:hypothetical protein